MVFPVLLAVAGGGIGLLALWFRPAPEKFRFIAVNAPVLTGVFPPLETLTASIPPFEYQVFSWQADYYEVCGEAAAELTALGYECKPLPYPLALVFSNGSIDVWIEAKRSETHRDAFRRDSYDSRWVTVTISRDAAHGIRTDLRMLLEPSL